MEFYDRRRELKDLGDKYNELKEGELCVIYGRRRLGKTVFIQKFLKKSKNVYKLTGVLYKYCVK